MSKAKWEYQFQYVPPEYPSLKLHIDDMQSEGWEIVSVVAASMSESPHFHGLTLRELLITWKRPNGN